MFRQFVSALHARQELSLSIHYCGKNYGWQVAAKKGTKPIVNITPVRQAFWVLCVMGHRELETIQNHPGLLSPGARQLIEDTRQYHDGKWVSIKVNTPAVLGDAMALFAIKRFGEKAADYFFMEQTE
jgi:hypothetical protein